MALEPFGNQSDQHKKRPEKEKPVDIAPEGLRDDQRRHRPFLVDMERKHKNIKGKEEQAIKVRTYRKTLLIDHRHKIQNKDKHQLFILVIPKEQK